MPSDTGVPAKECDSVLVLQTYGCHLAKETQVRWLSQIIWRVPGEGAGEGGQEGVL